MLLAVTLLTLAAAAILIRYGRGRGGARRIAVLVEERRQATRRLDATGLRLAGRTDSLNGWQIVS
jgi:hypothetical protein